MNRTRTLLGLGAGVLAVVFLGIGFWSAARRDDSGSITQAGSINSSELRVGDCFNLRDPTEVTIVDATQCSESHVYEVFYVGELSPGDYPAVEVIDAFAEAQCTPAFEAYVGHDFASSVWYVAYIGPSEETFHAGDRVLVCHLFNSTETAVTGSARGSGR
ncbi:MAG TPA: septum formation family protein [Candidatus Limnocylindria bacterium]|nr:septum formation family protein [Candidatus Limnocylindria bacterium]